MHSNVMEKLINSIKLISFSYMYSSNKTLDRFGIEYSYIASAMNSMLKSTNNSVKNIEINKTVGIVIDYNHYCILALMLLAMTVIGAGAAIISGIGIFWFLWGTVRLLGKPLYEPIPEVALIHQSIVTFPWMENRVEKIMKLSNNLDRLNELGD